MPWVGNTYVQDGAGIGAPQANETASPLSAGAAAIGKVGDGYTSAQTPISASSGNVAAATATATLAAVAGKTTYITGFTVSATGATSGLAVNVTVTGPVTGTLTYTFAAPAGVLVAAQPLSVQFCPPLPASGQNVAIAISMPTLGSGNTNASISATGYQE